MKVHITADPGAVAGLPLLAVPVFEGETPDEAAARLAGFTEGLGDALRRACVRGEVRGKAREQVLFFLSREDGGAPRRAAAIGVGERDETGAEELRRYAARAVRSAESQRVTELAILLPEGIEARRAGRAVAEGATLAAWDFRELKGPPREGTERAPLVESVTLVSPDRGSSGAVAEGAEVGRVVAEAENFARTLQARPGNIATPSHLADEASRIAGEAGLGSRILGPAELAEERMGALLAVSAGSAQEPRLIVLEHRGGGEGDPPVILVGKGLTFDAGGISLKPSSGMEEMKYDMSGGAAVIAAMEAIARLDLPLNVTGIVPSSENLPSGTSVKPGDIVRTRAGKTVEVVNTDAEGRLILCDALSYAVDLGPSAIVDCATLTGSCVIALGHHASGVLGTDEGLVEELRRAGDESGERCWPLPLWDDYRSQLDTEHADMKNVGGRPAGTITAAWFLREFVGEVPWAHLDIAGTAYGDEVRRPYLRKGGFGVPTRLLLEWVMGRAGVAAG